MIDELAFAHIERGNRRFVRLIQAEVKDIEVFCHAFRFGGFGQSDNVVFHQPAQNDLRHAFAVLCANFRQNRIAEDMVFAFGKGRPGSVS